MSDTEKFDNFLSDFLEPEETLPASTLPKIDLDNENPVPKSSKPDSSTPVDSSTLPGSSEPRVTSTNVDDNSFDSQLSNLFTAEETLDKQQSEPSVDSFLSADETLTTDDPSVLVDTDSLITGDDIVNPAEWFTSDEDYIVAKDNSNTEQIFSDFFDDDEPDFSSLEPTLNESPVSEKPERAEPTLSNQFSVFDDGADVSGFSSPDTNPPLQDGLTTDDPVSFLDDVLESSENGFDTAGGQTFNGDAEDTSGGVLDGSEGVDEGLLNEIFSPAESDDEPEATNVDNTEEIGDEEQPFENGQPEDEQLAITTGEEEPDSVPGNPDKETGETGDGNGEVNNENGEPDKGSTPSSFAAKMATLSGIFSKFKDQVASEINPNKGSELDPNAEIHTPEDENEELDEDEKKEQDEDEAEKDGKKRSPLKTAIIILVSVAAVLGLLYFIGTFTTPRKIDTGLVDNGNAEFNSFTYDKKTGKVTGKIKNNGDITSKMYPSFNVYGMNFFNPVSYVKPKLLTHCDAGYVVLEPDAEVEVSAQCEKVNAGKIIVNGSLE